MATLDIVALRSFDAVATFSSVRKTAEVLGLSQPAVTGHLRRLERELGCALVMRQGRGITLTGDGDLLADRARQLLELHDEAIEVLRPAREDELIVAATEHAAEAVVPLLVSTIKELMPNMAVRLRLTRSLRARELLQGSRADIALTLTSPAREGRMVTNVDLEWFGRRGASSDKLVLFQPPCAVRYQATAALAGRDYSVAKECSNLSSVLSAVHDTHGVTPLPRFGSSPDGLICVADLPRLPAVPLYLATGPRVPVGVENEVIRRVKGELEGGARDSARPNPTRTL